MAKNNKKSPAQQAAAEEAAQQEAKVNTQQQTAEDPSFAKVVTMSKDKSLSQDSKVIMANLIDKNWVHDSKYAAIAEGASVLRDALMGDVIVTQIVNGVDTFALIVRRDEQRYLAIKSMLASQGITLPDLKALPAPTEEQLQNAGIKLLPAQTAVAIVKAEDVSEEAKAQKKAEKKIEEEKPSTNPAEIKDEKQLAKSLSYLLTAGADKLNLRVQRVIDFYRGYLTIQANHAENKEEALKAVKDKTRAAMLKEISEIVGPCPFAFHGAAHLLLTRLESTKSIIVPFGMYYRNANENNNNPLSEDFVADITRILMIWSCDSKIANCERTINEHKRLINKNENIINTSKDKTEVKVAKSAIATYNGTIEKQQELIDSYKALADLVKNPTFDSVDNLIANYDSDENSDEYKMAHAMVDTIMKTYYKDIDPKKVDKNIMLANAQQRCGIIINMFRDPLAQSISYSESNLVELKETEETKPEEKPAEEEAKN